jgi:hypothetical protein
MAQRTSQDIAREFFSEEKRKTTQSRRKTAAALGTAALLGTAAAYGQPVYNQLTRPSFGPSLPKYGPNPATYLNRVRNYGTRASNSLSSLWKPTSRRSVTPSNSKFTLGNNASLIYNSAGMVNGQNPWANVARNVQSSLNPFAATPNNAALAGPTEPQTTSLAQTNTRRKKKSSVPYLTKVLISDALKQYYGESKSNGDNWFENQLKYVVDSIKKEQIENNNLTTLLELLNDKIAIHNRNSSELFFSPTEVDNILELLKNINITKIKQEIDYLKSLFGQLKELRKLRFITNNIALDPRAKVTRKSMRQTHFQDLEEIIKLIITKKNNSAISQNKKLKLESLIQFLIDLKTNPSNFNQQINTIINKIPSLELNEDTKNKIIEFLEYQKNRLGVEEVEQELNITGASSEGGKKKKSKSKKSRTKSKTSKK